MGYCYFCEEEWLGYVSAAYFCSECRKLQHILKAFGRKKTLNAIKIKIEKTNPPYQTI